MLETTAFYQKWICRRVRHFFSFFLNFSTLLRQFFQLWSCHGHFPTLQLPAHVCSNFQHSISNGSKVMDNSSFDCLMLKGQGVQQELCTVYTAKGQGVHLLLLYLPVVPNWVHWWFIDGTTNTFSNAHYSQTTHPNWTKPSQGASPNVRISFGNNMGPNNFFVTFHQSVLRGRNVL